MSGQILISEAGAEINVNENFAVNQILAISLGVGFGIVVVFAIALVGLYIHYWKGGICRLFKVIFKKRPTSPIPIIPMVANNTTYLTSPPSIDRTCKPRKMPQEPLNTQTQVPSIVQISSSTEAENKTGLNNSRYSIANYVLSCFGVYCTSPTFQDADEIRDSVVIDTVFGRP